MRPRVEFFTVRNWPGLSVQDLNLCNDVLGEVTHDYGFSETEVAAVIKESWSARCSRTELLLQVLQRLGLG